MGLIKNIKRFFELRKALKNSIREFEEQNAVYLTLTAEEMKQMPEEELYQAVWARTEKKMEAQDDFRILPEKQRIYFCAV